MAYTFADYYSGEQIDIYSLYNQTLMSGKMLVRSKARDFAELEKYLNDLFYGKDPDNKQRELMIEMLAKAYEEEFGKPLGKFDITTMTNSNSAGIGDLENFPTIIKQIGAQSHAKQIQASTLGARAEQINTFIDNIKILIEQHQGSSFMQELKNLQDLAKNTLNDIEKVLKEAGVAKDSSSYIKLSNNNDLKAIIDRIDAGYNQLLAISEGGYTPQELGFIMEFLVAAAGVTAQQMSQQLGEMGIEDFIKQATASITGAVRTGGGSNGLGFKLEVEKQLFQKSDDKANTYSYTTQDGKLNFSFTKDINWNKSRQGKMDVSFTLPNNPNNNAFRLSIKNWADTAGGDFGSTQLLYALLRSLEQDNVTALAFLEADNRASAKQINEAEKLMKLSIVLDILIGYSQTSLYADTIVINDRSKSRIIVKSMASILDEVSTHIENMNISGFDKFRREEMINLKLDVMKKLRSNRSENVRYVLYRYLQSLKMTLTYSNIIKFSA